MVMRLCTYFVPRVEYEVRERSVMASTYGAVVLQKGPAKGLGVGIITAFSTHVLEPHWSMTLSDTSATSTCTCPGICSCLHK